MASTLVLGCTGMVGAYILSTLRGASSSQVSRIEILARRQPKADPKANIDTIEYINKDTETWASHIKSISPPPSLFFSSLATTRAAAGGFDKQYKIEHDLNIELAKAAKESGTKTYVLISSGAASTKSLYAYLKMKGEIEEHAKEIGFDHTIILQPGMISGYREESRPAEAVIRKIAAGMGQIYAPLLKDTWAQDADVIARAAVAAGLMAERGELKEKVWVMGQKDIMRLGKHEWKSI